MPRKRKRARHKDGNTHARVNTEPAINRPKLTGDQIPGKARPGVAEGEGEGEGRGGARLVDGGTEAEAEAEVEAGARGAAEVSAEFEADGVGAAVGAHSSSPSRASRGNVESIF